MKSRAYSVVLAASLAGLFSCGNASETPLSTPTSGSTNISVDESFQPIIETQVNTFEGIYERANIDAAYKPEGEVVKDLVNDSTRIAILSRELTAEEVAAIKQNQRIPRTTKLAIDAVALITNPNNPDSLLTMDEVRDIFNGRVKNWGELVLFYHSAYLESTLALISQHVRLPRRYHHPVSL